MKPHRSVITVIAFFSTVFLFGLALTKVPLPFSSLSLAIHLTVVVAAICALTVMAVHRLHPFSFPTLFLGATFLFTCSSLVIYFVDPNSAFRHWRTWDQDLFGRALVLIMLAFCAFLLGSLLSRPRILETGEAAPQVHSSPTQGRYVTSLRATGVFLFGLSVLVVLYYTYQGSALAYAYDEAYQGYSDARYYGEFPRLITACLSYFLPWSVIILTAVCKSKREFRGVAVATFAAISLMLLSGDRTGPLTVMAMVAAALYLKRSEGWSIRWNWRQVTVLVLVMLVLIPTIQNLRRVPIRLWSVDEVAAAATPEDTPTNSRLGIFGETLDYTSTSLETFVGTIFLLETTESYRYGFDYVRPIIVAIPFHSRLMDVLDIRFNERGPGLSSQPTWWITYHFNYYGKSGLGYLQLAEAYLQFGAFGVLGLYLLLGFFLTHTWKRVQNYRLSPQKLALLLIGFTGILIWVRNDASGVLRNLFWAWLIIYLWPSLSRGRLPIRKKRVEAPAGPVTIGISR